MVFLLAEPRVPQGITRQEGNWAILTSMANLLLRELIDPWVAWVDIYSGFGAQHKQMRILTGWRTMWSCLWVSISFTHCSREKCTRNSHLPQWQWNHRKCLLCVCSGSWTHTHTHRGMYTHHIHKQPHLAMPCIASIGLHTKVMPNQTIK